MDWFKKEQQKSLAEGMSYVKSTSFPVLASHTISLMHGGGVIGLRSCKFPHISVKLQAQTCINWIAPTLLPKPHIRARMGCFSTCRLEQDKHMHRKLRGNYT